jgi:hypothetical protein
MITCATFRPNSGNGLQQLDLVLPRPARFGDHRVQLDQGLLDQLQPPQHRAGQPGMVDIEMTGQRLSQIRDLAPQLAHEPFWAAPEGHRSTALIGEIAVWRAANAISPQDPRLTGATQLETLPALWKQRLDRDIARSTDSSGNARFNVRQAAHTALRPWHDRQRPYQKPERRPNRPSAPGP